jgi:hypothetical protein
MNGVLTSEKHVVEKIFFINESAEFSREISRQQMASNENHCFLMAFYVMWGHRQKME